MSYNLRSKRQKVANVEEVPTKEAIQLAKYDCDLLEKRTFQLKEDYQKALKNHQKLLIAHIRGTQRYCWDLRGHQDSYIRNGFNYCSTDRSLGLFSSYKKAKARKPKNVPACEDCPPIIYRIEQLELADLYDEDVLQIDEKN